MLEASPEVSKNPSPRVGLDGLGDFSLNMRMRYHLPTVTFHRDRFAVLERVHTALREAKVAIPFPRQVVELKKDSLGV